MYVYVISPGFSHDFGPKYGDFDVYVISPGFLVCFQNISAFIGLIFLTQMRIAGKFTFVRHPCHRVIFAPNVSSLMFMQKCAGFSGCFHEVPAPVFCNSLSQIRLAGEFTFFLRRCLLAIGLSKSMDLSVYGLSPRFPGSFSIISSPISGADAFRRGIHLPTASAPLRHLPSRTTNLCVYGISPRFLHVCAIIILHYSRIEIRQKPRPRKRF